MFIKVLLIGLVGFLGRWDDMLGNMFLNRPFIMGTLAGLVMGDLQQGIILGMTLELLMIGTFPVGAAVPPDYVNAGLLGTAFAIASGGGASIATALAYPIALLFGFFMNALLIFEVPFVVRFADRCADKGDVRAVARTNVIGHLIWSILFGVVTAICFALGSAVMESIVEVIPPFVMNGMNTAACILPALGFALLIRMIGDRKVMPFLLLGFLLSAYLGIPTVGVTLIAVAIVLIIFLIPNKEVALSKIGGNEDDF